jgi:hypothetical protein
MLDNIVWSMDDNIVWGMNDDNIVWGFDDSVTSNLFDNIVWSMDDNIVWAMDDSVQALSEQILGLSFDDGNVVFGESFLEADTIDGLSILIEGEVR